MKVLGDFTTTVEKALEEIDPNWESYEGLVVCGTHTPNNVSTILNEIQLARESKKPFLGICFGHQLAAVEYARNVMGLIYANSQEVEPLLKDEWVIVAKRSEGLKVGLHGGESYWNNYEVIKGFEDVWVKEPNFITCQFHPEYQSSKYNPHPLLIKFLNECKAY